MKTLTSTRSLTIVLLSALSISCGGSDNFTLTLTDLNVQLDQDNVVEIDLNPLHPTGANFTYEIVKQPKYGDIRTGSDQRHWIYTPYKNYFGDDTFEFKAINGSEIKTAEAYITVSEVFVTGRPMSVSFYELTSPSDGQLDVTWYNSFDIDGAPENLQYHVYLSTNEDFYPSEATRITTLTGELNTSITGLNNGETYYLAVLAEDIDGKFSKEIDKQKITLTPTKLEFKDNDTVMFARDLPITTISLGEAEVTLSLSGSIQDLTGKVLQLDEANDFAFIFLESANNTSNAQHSYTYHFADPQEFLQSLAFSTNKGAYDPENALRSYYQYTAAPQISGIASANASAALIDLSDEDLARLLSWANLDSVDELYEYFRQTTHIDLNVQTSERVDCGSFSPEFEPLNNPWQPSPLDFKITLTFACSIGYSLQIKWDNVAFSEPEIIRAELLGAIDTSLSTSGILKGNFLDGAVDLPRKRQLVIGRVLRLGYIPIPLTIALNAKGTLQGEGYGEVTADLSTHVETGVNYGTQYTADEGFSEVGTGLYSKTKTASTDGSLSAVDITTSVGIEIKSSVGPEVILSLINVKPAYRLGKNGLATMATHIGPQIKVKLETSPNPNVVVENLNATPFGISAYEWAINLAAQNRLTLYVPLHKEANHDSELVSVPLLHLPEFELSYNDKPNTSNEFELRAAPSDFWTWNDADLTPNRTLWHVIQSQDATLSHENNNPLHADGQWSKTAHGDSVFVLEYQPETLSTLVANLSGLTKGMSKQYATYGQQLMLEGEWLVEGELNVDFKPVWLGSACYPGAQSSTGRWSFEYDELHQEYLPTINSMEWSGAAGKPLEPFAVEFLFVTNDEDGYWSILSTPSNWLKCHNILTYDDTSLETIPLPAIRSDSIKHASPQALANNWSYNFYNQFLHLRGEYNLGEYLDAIRASYIATGPNLSTEVSVINGDKFIVQSTQTFEYEVTAIAPSDFSLLFQGYIDKFLGKHSEVISMTQTFTRINPLPQQ